MTVVTTRETLLSSGAVPEALDEPVLDAAQLLADARDELVRHGGAEVRTVEREGDPAEALLAAARADGADLIVVGRRGTSFVARALLGSVSARIVEHAPCDVIVVA